VSKPTGHRLPAEWEPQNGVMLTWPHATTDWGPKLAIIERLFAQIGTAIAARETLLSVCSSAAHAEQTRRRLLSSGAPATRLVFGIAPSDDCWARDHAPLTTLHEGRARLHDFGFNGWGDKYPACKDTAITAAIAEQQVFSDCEILARPFVLEGGAIETDGKGTLLATRSSLISEARNPGFDQARIEQLLAEWLGLDHFLWLDHGRLCGDDTDGHVDTLARFADPQTILHASAPPGDPDYAELDSMTAELKAMRNRDGRRYRLLALPFPSVHRDNDGRRLPASYANFLIINRAVLLPTYGVAQDKDAIRVLQLAFPQRQIVPIDCRELIGQNGSLHCLTMQFPAQVALRNGKQVAAA